MPEDTVPEATALKPLTETAAARREVQGQFLDLLAHGETVKDAAALLGVGRRTLYVWRERDADFRALWQGIGAQDKNYSALEREAIRRAVKGVEKPVYRGGEVVGHVTDYSDSMLMFLLKAHNPEKYDPRALASQDSKKAGTQPEGTFDMERAKDALLSKFAQKSERSSED